jgi:hypothetical protein
MDPDPDADPSIFIINLQDDNQKIIFLTKFFCTLLFEGTFTSFFKRKKSKRSHKTVEIKVFLTFCTNDRRIQIRIQEAQKHVEPVDSEPDLQHCLVVHLCPEDAQLRLLVDEHLCRDCATGSFSRFGKFPSGF